MGAMCVKEDVGSVHHSDHKAEEKSAPKVLQPRESLPIYTMEEVQQHDYWMAVDGFVVDVERFYSEHPGGSKIILQYTKKDATIIFMSSHGKKGVAKLKELAIGTIKDFKNVGEELDDI